MKRDFKIFTDTGADDLENLKNKGADIVPLYITFEEGVYLKHCVDITIEEFYKKLSGNLPSLPRTSLPSVQDFVDAFSPYLKEGKDILYISLNANFSGSYQAALNAAEILTLDFPDLKIKVIDSRCATVAYSFLVSVACDMQSEGKSLDDIIEKISILKDQCEIVFTVDTLKYLKEGGRIGKASALLGELLNIKPIILMKDAELLPITKVRGRNKSIRTIIDYVKEHIDSNINDYYICIAYSGVDDEVWDFKKEVEKELKIENIPVAIVGICIGIHTGPGVLGIGYFKTKL